HRAPRRLHGRARHRRADHRRVGGRQERARTRAHQPRPRPRRRRRGGDLAHRRRHAGGALPRPVERFSGGARPRAAQHPHHLRRDRGAPEDEAAAHCTPRSAAAGRPRPGRAAAAHRAVRGHPRRGDPQGDDTRRGGPQPRRAGRGGGAQRDPQAARHRLHRRVPRPPAPADAERRIVQLVLVSGLSGSGKSIALRVLEDSGYYCVDNLPANLLMETVDFLAEAIERERALLAGIAPLGSRIDTTDLQPRVLQNWIRDLLGLGGGALTLLFESFSYKDGIPLDADWVLDCRMLANPYYDPQLRPYTGCDAPVIDYLKRDAAVRRWLDEMRAMLQRWLPAIVRENRRHVTVATGCTGGRHRSVFLAEELAKAFGGDWRVLVRH